MKRKSVILFLLLFLLICFASNVSAYTMYTINNPVIAYASDPGVLPSDYSGAIKLQGETASSFLVTLTNLTTTVPVDFPSNVALTGWGFVLPDGVTITGGHVEAYQSVSEPFKVKIGTATYINTAEVINRTWGYDTTKPFNTPTTGTIYENVFNAGIATLSANVDSAFLGGTGGIDGPKHGILKNPPFTKDPYIYNWVQFSVSVGFGSYGGGIEGLTAAIYGGPNLLAFGSPTQMPEPGTMLLLGVGLIGLAGFGRKKLFQK